MSNPNFRRFPLTYDEEFDADIHEVITSTPVRRRSERVRELIRLGLAAESGEAFKSVRAVGHKQPSPTTISTVKTLVPAAAETGTDRPRERKVPKFQPPE